MFVSACVHFLPYMEYFFPYIEYSLPYMEDFFPYIEYFSSYINNTTYLGVFFDIFPQLDFVVYF